MVKNDARIECHFLYYTCSGDGCTKFEFPVGDLFQHIQTRHRHRHIQFAIDDSPIPEDVVEELANAFESLAQIPVPHIEAPVLEFEYFLGSHYIHCRAPACSANTRIVLAEVGNHIRQNHPLPAANVTVRTRRGFLLSNALKQDITDLGKWFAGGLPRAPTGPIELLAPTAAPVPAPAEPPVNTGPPRRSGALSFLLNPSDTEAEPSPRPKSAEPASAADLETASILLEFKEKS